MKQNTFKLLIAMLIVPVYLHASSAISSPAIFTEISSLHAQEAKINDKLTKGDISQKKADAKLFPVWKQLAQNYSNLSSLYFYDSKSSIGLSVPNQINFFGIILGSSVPDIYLSAQDIALVNAALKTGNVLDVRVFFDPSAKMCFYSVVNIATNLTVVSGSAPAKSQVVPTSWYLIVCYPPHSAAQINSKVQTLNNSIYLHLT